MASERVYICDRCSARAPAREGSYDSELPIAWVTVRIPECGDLDFCETCLREIVQFVKPRSR